MRKVVVDKNFRDNDFGIISVVLGILAIALAISIPTSGFILSVISLIFSQIQKKKSQNIWGRRGKILSIIGIILNLLMLALIVWVLKNPGIGGL